ncbi:MULTISPECIES: ATP-binding protein [Methylomicrobium]|uniref:histidine kinase n=1 Tax=Methylomicrobium album BG8 TaxID=686340 RepID=H8GN06_METAL|nr:MULTISPECIES: ATP-binding protein [Methylomicrobium]EIC30720.1 PAS domain S-box [Methylomicrobium album BG8]
MLSLRKVLPTQPLVRETGAILLMALVYYLAARLAAFNASEFAGNAMAIWPASGISLAAVLVCGYRLVIGAGLGSFAYNLLYLSQQGGMAMPAVSGAAIMAFGSMLEFALAGYLFKLSFSGLAPETLRDIKRFTLICFGSGTVGAAAGCLGLLLSRQMDFGHYSEAAFTWWVGDAAGMLVMTPLLLVWNRKESRRGLLFPLVAPCIGLTMCGFFIVHQFETRLTQSHSAPVKASVAAYSGLSRNWLSWNVLLAGITLTLILADYLEVHRREQNALRSNEKRLKRQNLALSRIALGDSISSGDLYATLKIMTETSAATLEVERASIWLFNDDRTALCCADLYELGSNRHLSGGKLSTADYPSYFAALLGARNIAVDDTFADPVTQEFRDHYLPQFSITSLLDAPIQFGNEMIGVICHEHVGTKRHWTLDEQNFAGSIADLASLAFEVVKRKEAEDKLRAANLELEAKVRERTVELIKLNAELLAEAADRRQAEATLRESELRLRLATKAADIGVWDWNIVDDSVMFTPEYKRQIGYEDHEIAGHYLEWESRLHPEDKDRAIADNFEYIERKKSAYESEFRLRHKNGSYLWIRSRGEAVAWDQEGRPTRILGCHVDITQLKQTEETLRAFRWFSESAGQGMGMAKMQGEVIYMNPALKKTLASLGIPFDPSKVLTDYYTEEAARRLSSEVLPKLLGHGQWIGELELGKSHGKRIPTLDNFFAVCDEGGNPQYVANIVTDMSQQKEIERQLLQAKEAAVSADRTKSMFIATMSHELRTPLNAIIGFTGILLQGLSGDLNERQRDQLSRVARSARHLLDLITDIIDISKIEAGRIDVFPSDFDLHALVSQATDTVKAQAQEKGLVLTMDAEPFPVHSDQKRVLQCVINLLSNAIKYTEQGSVAISARAADGKVSIEIRDTGIGIETEQMQKLFIPFERLDSFLRLRTSGTGLGLYLTRKIAVDLLSGDVSVVSTPGTGSCFTLKISDHLGAK